MKFRARIAAALALAAVPAPTHAQAYQCVLPQRIERPSPPSPDGAMRLTPVGWYTLAVSWSPEYCRFGGNRASMQCSGRNGRFGFVLHGL